MIMIMDHGPHVLEERVAEETSVATRPKHMQHANVQINFCQQSGGRGEDADQGPLVASRPPGGRVGMWGLG